MITSTSPYSSFLESPRNEPTAKTPAKPAGDANGASFGAAFSDAPAVAVPPTQPQTSGQPFAGQPPQDTTAAPARPAPPVAEHPSVARNPSGGAFGPGEATTKDATGPAPTRPQDAASYSGKTAGPVPVSELPDVAREESGDLAPTMPFATTLGPYMSGAEALFSTLLARQQE